MSLATVNRENTMGPRIVGTHITRMHTPRTQLPGTRMARVITLGKKSPVAIITSTTLMGQIHLDNITRMPPTGISMGQATIIQI